jgi:cytochrome P450
MTAKLAPGPRGDPLLGNLLAFRRDVLNLLLEGRRHFGDVVRFRLGPLLVHLVAHPDGVKHVLVTNQHNFNKDTRSSAKIRSITGPGLLTSNGEFWLRQRRLMQPAFHPQQVAAFTGIMTETVAQRLRFWQQVADKGQPLDVASEMMRLTYTIVGRALFGADVSTDLEAVERAATVVMAHAWQRLEKLLDWPDFVPTPRNRRFRSALNVIDRVVQRIIAERRRDPIGRTDFLSLLLHQTDAETGGRMSDEQLRNEAVTLLLAGHETTANALTWTWYLLSRHPEARRRVQAEVAEVLAGRPPVAAELSRLEYTTRVLQEAMRLYPPIWIMERRVLADDEIAGYFIPAGSSVVLCPYVTHRHPDFWDNPEGFDPDRFLPERAATRPNYAYFPFGGGQRLCIGNAFALAEAQVITAMVTQQFHLDLVPGFRVEPQPGITLRSRHGLLMTLHRPRGPLGA